MSAQDIPRQVHLGQASSRAGSQDLAALDSSIEEQASKVVTGWRSHLLRGCNPIGLVCSRELTGWESRVITGHWYMIVALMLIVLIFYGPGKLPEIGGAIGKAMREFRKSVDSIKTEVNSTTPTATATSAAATGTSGTPAISATTEGLGEANSAVEAALPSDKASSSH